MIEKLASQSVTIFLLVDPLIPESVNRWIWSDHCFHIRIRILLLFSFCSCNIINYLEYGWPIPHSLDVWAIFFSAVVFIILENDRQYSGEKSQGKKSKSGEVSFACYRRIRGNEFYLNAPRLTKFTFFSIFLSHFPFHLLLLFFFFLLFLLMFFFLFIFLVADKRLYKRLCLSVRPLVRRSVGPWWSSLKVWKRAFPPLPTRPRLV